MADLVYRGCFAGDDDEHAALDDHLDWVDSRERKNRQQEEAEGGTHARRAARAPCAVARLAAALGERRAKPQSHAPRPVPAQPARTLKTPVGPPWG